MTRAAFLDRDGTINLERGHIRRPEHFELRPGTVEGLMALRSAGFLLIVVTNQSWIGERLQIGDATAKVISPCPRCVMTTRAFEDVPQDRHVLRAIVDNFARNFGVYAKITSPGRVAIGSEIQPV